MLVSDPAAMKRLVARLLDEAPALPDGDLSHVARDVIARRDEFLSAAGRAGTPSYLFDGAGFGVALAEFSRVFDRHIRGHRAFYAVKSNHHPLVVGGAVTAGFGLDVSSGRELSQALALPGCPILFSGPAKSEDDLLRAVRHADRVTVHLDSFGELLRLGAVTRRLGCGVRAGVRITTDHHGAWSKFGIPIGDLARFWREAERHPRIELCGMQFHVSWNRDAEPYLRSIADLSHCLARELTAADRARIAFIDVGGGFRPHRLEGYFPGDSPAGAVIRVAAEHYGREPGFLAPHYVKDSIPVEEYARAIGASIDRELRPLVAADCACYTEPGRILSTYAMHILLRVVDKKSDRLVIVDGGVNMVGWEKYLHIYCPVVNLTRPAEREIELRMGGSLCDCEDVWGSRVFASGIEEGDLLLVPYQGAYTYAVAQDFIRPIPPVFAL